MPEFKNNLKAFVVAVALGTGAMALVWAYQQPDPVAGTKSMASAPSTASQDNQGDILLALTPDQAGEAGDIRIVYRGLVEPRHLRIDVTIPDLDPFYAYPHTIDLTTAREGFSLAGHRFHLVSVNRSGIRLKWTRPKLG